MYLPSWLDRRRRMHPDTTARRSHSPPCGFLVGSNPGSVTPARRAEHLLPRQPRVLVPRVSLLSLKFVARAAAPRAAPARSRVRHGTLEAHPALGAEHEPVVGEISSPSQSQNAENRGADESNQERASCNGRSRQAFSPGCTLFGFNHRAHSQQAASRRLGCQKLRA